MVLLLAQQRAASTRGAESPAGGAAADVLEQLNQCMEVSRQEVGKEGDADAATALRSNVDRWGKARRDIESLLGGGEEEGSRGEEGEESVEEKGKESVDGGDEAARSVGGRHGKRKAEGRAEGGGGGRCAGKKKQKVKVRLNLASPEAVESAAKAVMRAEAQEREKVSTHAYLSSLRCEQAPPAVGSEEAQGMEIDEEGGERGKTAPPMVETCPICLDERGAAEDAAWSITACGHSGCYECMTGWLRERQVCPCCKCRLTPQGLYEVEAVLPKVRAAPAAGAASSSAAGKAAAAWRDEGLEAAVEEYGTKVAALVQELAAVHAAGGKAVVFSAWTRLLKLAGSALSAHGFRTASLVGSPADKRQALAAFAGDANVLLVPLFGGASGAGGGGAAGLTLTQASVAVLLEPALQPGIERQAAGRIARIGQTQKTRLVRLIVDQTIEQQILEWQKMRLANGGSANNTLTLNDFAALVGEDPAATG